MPAWRMPSSRVGFRWMAWRNGVPLRRPWPPIGVYYNLSANPEEQFAIGTNLSKELAGRFLVVQQAVFVFRCTSRVDLNQERGDLSSSLLLRPRLIQRRRGLAQNLTDQVVLGNIVGICPDLASPVNPCWIKGNVLRKRVVRVLQYSYSLVKDSSLIGLHGIAI